MRKLSVIFPTVLITLIALVNTTTCLAQTFTVPLPQVIGNYPAPSGPAYYDKYFSFDLGTTLSQINSVTFVCSGTITCPQSSNFFMDFKGNIFEMAETTMVGASTYPNPEPFSSQAAFFPGTNWNFLLDGKADGYVELNTFISLDIPGNPPPIQPIGTIDNASLVIDAVVPEPATLLLLGLGGFMLRKRK